MTKQNLFPPIPKQVQEMVCFPPLSPIEKNKKISLEKRIKNLPIEIQRYIYKEFIQTEYYYLMFSRLIRTRPSYSLYIIDIRPLIPILLSNKKIVDYLCKYAKCDAGYHCFAVVYKEHKIKKQKTFVNMTKGNSFAHSLLMYYHH